MRRFSTSVWQYTRAPELGVKVKSFQSSKQALRRLPTKKPQLPPSPQASLQPCTTISSCESYNLPKTVELLHNEGFLQASILLPGEVAHVEYPYEAGKVADVLVLANGSVVSWGMNESETEDKIVEMLKEAERRPYKHHESEDVDFVVENMPNEDNSQPMTEAPEATSTEDPAGEKSYMKGETIVLRGPEKKMLLDKVAFSSGLARSTKLGALEESLERYIDSLKVLTDRLASGEQLRVGEREVLTKTGQLLQLRGQLNLYSELIETPDLYWSEPELERLYALISKNLDIGPRIGILNRKLDYASEVVAILKAHMAEKQSVRLEWMIIVLIMIEVGFECIHFWEKYRTKEDVEVEVKVPDTYFPSA